MFILESTQTTPGTRVVEKLNSVAHLVCQFQWSCQTEPLSLRPETTVESLKFRGGPIFVDGLNFTGSWGCNFVYFYISIKGNMTLLPY